MLKLEDTTIITQNSKNQKINIDELLEEYELDFSMFTRLDDRLLGIESKWKSLSLPERIFIILYAEYPSYRKVAKILGCSHSTVNKYIKEIRSKLC